MKTLALGSGLLLLALVWGGPLPAMAAHSFSAHMTMHMSVVALAAPLIAAGLVGTSFDPTGRLPLLFSPLLAAMLEFVVVWGWHLPALHGAARAGGVLLVVEQASFLAAGLLLWLSCLGRAAGGTVAGALIGTLGLLVTSMHMTLLGALIAFAGRPLYGHVHGGDATSVVADQQMGGVIMLLAGGAAYLAGGLFLMARVVLSEETRRTAP
ncbi:MAG: Cytochrome c oxidase caa3-type, assembly factor CtaG-related protein [Xanthobacteraceae bacterium]|jgi:putative membrane protein|nr:Cytochrome c oxidase caa3-type, assembly factor CtaG-related protein [Xanthobacteraceae bacterium]